MLAVWLDGKRELSISGAKRGDGGDGGDCGGSGDDEVWRGTGRWYRSVESWCLVAM